MKPEHKLQKLSGVLVSQWALSLAERDNGEPKANPSDPIKESDLEEARDD